MDGTLPQNLTLILLLHTLSPQNSRFENWYPRLFGHQRVTLKPWHDHKGTKEKENDIILYYIIYLFRKLNIKENIKRKGGHKNRKEEYLKT